MVRQIRGLPQRYYPQIEADMEGVGGGLMLDLGGRDGSASGPFVGRFSRRVVVDKDEAAAPDVVADGVGRLPFSEGTFSYVLSLEVLEHIGDPQGFLSEAARVLKVGGHLALSTRQYFRTHGSPDDFFRYTEYGLRLVFSGSGLRIDHMIPLGGPFTIMAIAWDQLCGQIGLGRPVLKQIVSYPALLCATWLDGIVVRSAFFRREPDTSGWLVFATLP
jgi:SAM-dependent methyltransferase